MKAAYKILGYDDVYHMAEAFVNVKDCDIWEKAYTQSSEAKESHLDAPNSTNCWVTVK
jgi:hypothetical protein